MRKKLEFSYFGLECVSGSTATDNLDTTTNMQNYFHLLGVLKLYWSHIAP